MPRHPITLFRSYPFAEGQKIHIADGPRRGDWEVVAATERKVTLRCPISLREFTWNRFCYFAEEQEDAAWPRKDE